MRRITLICLRLVTVVGAMSLLSAVLSASPALASAPTVTLGEPANGALITGGQPLFSGSGGDSPTYSGTVTINVYAGTSTSAAVPTEVLHTPVVGGGFSAQAVGLTDGTYTAVASEPDTDPDPNTGTSSPVTFALFNGTPGLSLTAPPAPIRTAAPTFTGTGQTSPGDAQTVSLVIYPGTTTNATPVAVLSGAIATDGTFSIQVLPGLANGTYTAVASQQLAFSTTFSPSVQFTVASTAPALTVTSPSLARPTEPQTGVVLAGVAGDDYGDDATLALAVYRGATASGTAVANNTVTRTGSTWSDHLSSPLALGTYTLVVSQGDLSGQTTTVTRTFTVAAPGSVPGAITISATGTVTARLSCLDGAGTCVGDVLIVSKTDFQPAYGGPSGPLHLMFAHYSVAAAKSITLTAQLTSAQLRALRRAGPTKLVVTVAYSVGTKLAESSRTTQAVKVAAAPAA